MFWSPKPTIGKDDVEWQLGAWGWLLENLGGLEDLKALSTKYPRSLDFPKSGLSGHAHVAFVLSHICKILDLDADAFELEGQEASIDPRLGDLAILENAPRSAAGTYRLEHNRHIITYEPSVLRDLEQLIAVLVHEISHAILLSISTRPQDWGDNEEFMTDLATVFFGFGIFGGNQSFQFTQFRDDATGMQGWATNRLGYLTQNDWGFAIALRAVLTGEDIAPIKQYASDGLYANFKKNHRYLSSNRALLVGLMQ